ncbi:hypothetical protein ADUPG1_006552, partial [Aduncisulcus paluster]
VVGEHDIKELRRMRSFDEIKWPVEDIEDYKMEGSNLFFLARYLDGTDKWEPLPKVIGTLPLEKFIISHPELIYRIAEQGSKYKIKRKPGRKRKG